MRCIISFMFFSRSRSIQFLYLLDLSSYLLYEITLLQLFIWAHPWFESKAARCNPSACWTNVYRLYLLVLIFAWMLWFDQSIIIHIQKGWFIRFKWSSWKVVVTTRRHTIILQKAVNVKMLVNFHCRHGCYGWVLLLLLHVRGGNEGAVLSYPWNHFLR